MEIKQLFSTFCVLQNFVKNSSFVREGQKTQYFLFIYLIRYFFFLYLFDLFNFFLIFL